MKVVLGVENIIYKKYPKGGYCSLNYPLVYPKYN
nr:MAG TPA: hypothetical protein [Caudoviricetes sp.]